MKAVLRALLALLIVSCARLSAAKENAPVSVTAAPIGSPASWLNPNDYPAAAMRYAMTGITAFTLTVDATGKPSRCLIVQSSGFDILDTATCQRLMTNARFAPSRNRAGKPVERTYNGRVRWVLPEGAVQPVSETFGSMLLSIDQAGNVTSCRMAIHVPAIASASAEKPCGQGMGMPPAALGMEFRGNYQGSSAEVEIQQADAFTPDLRARVLSPVPGYEQRGLNIYHFTVTKDGKLGQCSYEEQRGSEHLATDYCVQAHRNNYDPPFSAFDKDGVANGWHIVRVLLKTGK
jgi:TonB family protein